MDSIGVLEMFIVKTHIGFELPISLNMDRDSAQVLYATLSLVSQNPNYPDTNRCQAVKMMDAINEQYMFLQGTAND